MQHKMLSCGLCLYVELVEQVHGMWDIHTVAVTEYQKTKFLQRTSLPRKANAVLQYWGVSTIDTVFASVYISILEWLDEVKCL